VGERQISASSFGPCGVEFRATHGSLAIVHDRWLPVQIQFFFRNETGILQPFANALSASMSTNDRLTPDLGPTPIVRDEVENRKLSQNSSFKKR
jgi:hypothetical protein